MPYGLPREEIPWYPRIDYNLCVGCQKCFNFCEHGVYEWDDEKRRPKVVNPYNCIVGCRACANLCPKEAISFPSREELSKAIKEARKRMKKE